MQYKLIAKKGYDCLQTQKRETLTLTFSFRKPSRRKKKLSRELWESSKPYQRSSVCSTTSWPYYGSDIQLAAQEAKLSTAQTAISGIRGRLRDIVEQQETVAFERGQIALDYAVCLPTCQYEDRSDKITDCC